MKLPLFVFFLIFLGNFARGTELQKGDLIFEISGNTEFSKAITSATAQEDSIKVVHVGIIDVKDNGEIYVIEASPQNGVQEISLKKFLSQVPHLNELPLVIIKRLNTDYPIETMLEIARSHRGEPYDWWYMPDNGKMYCSELVYEAYLDHNGDHIFIAKPMNFRDPNGEISQFWINLFQELNEEVPEGIPGTNPQDIFNDSRLITIRSESAIFASPGI